MTGLHVTGQGARRCRVFDLVHCLFPDIFFFLIFQWSGFTPPFSMGPPPWKTKRQRRGAKALYVVRRLSRTKEQDVIVYQLTNDRERLPRFWECRRCCVCVVVAVCVPVHIHIYTPFLFFPRCSERGQNNGWWVDLIFTPDTTITLAWLVAKQKAYRMDGIERF
jgi:hypothetical protein